MTTCFVAMHSHCILGRTFQSARLGLLYHSSGCLCVLSCARSDPFRSNPAGPAYITAAAQRARPHSSQITSRAAGRTFSDKLNPPLAPKLSEPARDNLPAFKYYFRLGKSYLSFYKEGLQIIYKNFKLTETLPVRALSRSKDIESAIRNGRITRSQYQLLMRVRSDISRIPLFALVFCVCGEFTPLVVLYMSGVVPRTLWVPTQISRARMKAHERLQKSEAKVSTKESSDIRALANSGQDGMRLLARLMGLYPAVLDTILHNKIPISFIERRVAKRFVMLQLDDNAIVRDGGPSGLREDEVRMACELRGMDVLGQKEGQVRSMLREWLEHGVELSGCRVE